MAKAVKLLYARSWPPPQQVWNYSRWIEVPDCAILLSVLVTGSPLAAQRVAVLERSSAWRTVSRFSQPGGGTVAWARLYPSGSSEAALAFETGGVSVAVEHEKLCGDGWDVLETEGVLRAMVVDGLGHGPFAEQAACEAMVVFRSQPRTGVASTLSLIDKALTKTRGAAGAIVELSPRKREVTAAGVGNVSMHLLYDGQSKGFGCDNGTLGAGVKRINEFRHPWVQGSILVMHSDGIRGHWGLDNYPGVVRRHPGVVAGLLYRDFQRGGDDATVIVVRHYL